MSLFRIILAWFETTNNIAKILVLVYSLIGKTGRNCIFLS